MKVSSSILNVISRSPLKPLQQQMQEIQLSVALLIPFFTESQAGHWAMAEQHQHKILTQSRIAKSQKKELRLGLPTSLLLPVNRDDLITLVHLQTDAAHQAAAIATLVLGRQLQLPETLAPRFMTYLQQAIDAITQANTAIQEIDNLLETGFYGKEVKVVEIMLEKLGQIENDTLELKAILCHELYIIEKELPPIDAMFIYNMIDNIGVLADRAQEIGEQLQLLLAD